MNQLVIIGNGFDLAHCLKTKYSDFLLSYLNRCFQKLKITNSYSDNLISISSPNINSLIRDFSSQKEFIIFARRYSINFNFKFSFIKDLFDEVTDMNWVDIEEYYYQKRFIIRMRT